jgi:hypothetical protein
MTRSRIMSSPLSSCSERTLAVQHFVLDEYTAQRVQLVGTRVVSPRLLEDFARARIDVGVDDDHAWIVVARDDEVIAANSTPPRMMKCSNGSRSHLGMAARPFAADCRLTVVSSCVDIAGQFTPATRVPPLTSM